MITGQVTPFSEAVIPLELHGPAGQIEGVEAIIDAGFTGALTISPLLVSRLQAPFRMTRLYQLADGAQVQFDEHCVTVVWDHQERLVDALVSDGGSLVGMALLKGNRLFIDVIDGGEVRIEPRP